MCDVCSVNNVVGLIDAMQTVIAGLDAESEHVAAALVAQAIDILRAKSQTD